MNEILYGDTFIIEEGHRLVFTAITDIHASKTPGKSYFLNV